MIVRWDSPMPESSNGIVTGYKIRFKQKKDDSRTQSVTTDAGQGMVSLVGKTCLSLLVNVVSSVCLCHTRRMKEQSEQSVHLLLLEYKDWHLETVIV